MKNRNEVKLVNIGMNRTCLFLFGVGAATLEDLQIDEAEGHEAESEPGHDSGEEDKEARDPGVDEPPRRSERYAAKPRRSRLQVPSQHPCRYRGIDQVHRSSISVCLSEVQGVVVVVFDLLDTETEF